MAIDVDDDYQALSWSFMSPWCGPYIWFKKLCKKYNFSGEYTDIEPGCDFFVHLTIEDGKEIKTIETSYLSKASISYLGWDYFLASYTYFSDWDRAEEKRKEFLKVCSSDSDKKIVAEWWKNIEIEKDEEID